LFGDLSRDQRCGAYRDRAKTAEIIAVAGYAAGSAALVTGLVLWLTRDDGEVPTPSVSVDAGAERAIVQYAGRF
jgi:hypothetical protein